MEIRWLLGLLVANLIVLGTILIVDWANEGTDRDCETWVLQSLRRSDDPSLPIGPLWLREAALDITALGSNVIVGLFLVASGGLLFLQKYRRAVAFLTIVALAGIAVVYALKFVIGRHRPDVVPHLREVLTPSFPSGHAALSAIVFLTVGVVFSRLATRRAVRVYCLAWTFLVTVLVGLSRVYLGVHYPSDVLAGWTIGLIWAIASWAGLNWILGWPEKRAPTPEQS